MEDKYISRFKDYSSTKLYKIDNASNSNPVKLTRLMYLIYKYNSKDKILDYLYDRKYEVNYMNENGMTPLFLICAISKEYDFDILGEFIKCGANIHHKDYTGNTLLHYAHFQPTNNICNIFAYLLSRGVNPNVQNASGNTVMHMLNHNNNFLALYELLIKENADVLIKNNKNQTVLDVIISNHNEDIKTISYSAKKIKSYIKHQTNLALNKRIIASIKSSDLLVCIVCMDHPRSVMFKPCRHMICCETCAKKLKKCSICSKAFSSDEIVTVFLS